MSNDSLLALCVYAFVASVTPGPSNVMLLVSGANFGFLRTLPQVFGITVGFSALLIGAGLGLGAILIAYPQLHVVLKIAGAAYLVYLASRIAMSRSFAAGSKGAARPLTFLESAGFQWVNPKAWVVAITTMALYTDREAPLLSVALIVVSFSLVNLPSVSVWAGFGGALREFLSSPVRLKWFNVAMAVLLVATLWPMLA